MSHPTPPTRIVEPVVSPETAVPTPAVCHACTESGNAALAKSTARRRKRDERRDSGIEELRDSPATPESLNP